MLSWQKLLTLLAILGVLALGGPASALATGPSAGDQQYIDPLGGSTGSHHSHSSGSGSSTGSGSSQASAPATPAAPIPTATSSTATTPSTASATPTATTASTPTSTTAADPGKTLPRTGFDAWLAALIGVGMLAGGACLRRTVRAR